ncbi:MAG: hypothetical protein H6926_02470 [Chromatiales bacterium]|nr:hypothetical protein [Chromatiales bacterium]
MRWAIRALGHDLANAGAVINGSRLVLEKLLADIFAACDAQGVTLSDKLRQVPRAALQHLANAQAALDPSVHALSERFENLAGREMQANALARYSRRVLVADAAPQGRELAANTIARRGYFVDRAGDTDSAIRFIRANRYDMVLLGIGDVEAAVDGGALVNVISDQDWVYPPALVGLSRQPMDVSHAVVGLYDMVAVVDPMRGGRDIDRLLQEYSPR